MRELGYSEGRDFTIEWRFAEGKYERFAEFGREFAHGNGPGGRPHVPFWCFDLHRGRRRARSGSAPLSLVTRKAAGLVS
jgi:hypothetical protein